MLGILSSTAKRLNSNYQNIEKMKGNKMEFNIGDRVRVKSYYDLPEEIKSKGISRIAGKDGEIIDKMWSEAKNAQVYKIHLDGYDKPSRVDFIEGSFDLIPDEEEPAYTYEFEFLENLVVARLYEKTEQGKTEIAKGHGHIIHDGVLGIAQASSYALKRIYFKLEEETNE